MYLLTRVPGAVCTTLAEKDERFLSFSDAVLNALRCGHGGRKERHPTCCGESALLPVGSPAAGWGGRARGSDAVRAPPSAGAEIPGHRACPPCQDPRVCKWGHMTLTWHPASRVRRDPAEQ